MPTHPNDQVISTTVRVDAPAERVWAAITAPEELIQWYAPGCRWEIPELREGASIRFFNSETDIQSARIARCVAPSELVLRWTPDANLPNTFLVNSYLLNADALGTTITIAQTGYASVPENMRTAWIEADAGAFPEIGKALASHLSRAA